MGDTTESTSDLSFDSVLVDDWDVDFFEYCLLNDLLFCRWHDLEMSRGWLLVAVGSCCGRLIDHMLMGVLLAGSRICVGRYSRFVGW